MKEKAKSALNLKSKLCGICLHREPKFCQVCQSFDQWKAIPPAQTFALYELSKGEIDWRSVR